MGDTADILKKLALQVRNASSAGENTAERVGRVLSGVLELIDAGSNIEELKKLFLSRTSPDSTPYLLSLLGGAVVEGGLLVKSPLTTRQLKTLLSDALTEEGNPDALGLDLIEEGDGNPDRLSAALMEESAGGGGASTLGELDNVILAADDVSPTNDLLLRKAGSEEWTIDNATLGNVSKLMNKVFPFTASLTGAGVYELGSTQSITLTWTYDRAITSQSLNDEVLDISLRAKTFNGVKARTTYLLKAVSGGQSYTSTVTADFRLKKYYGVSNMNLLSNAEILTLSSDWAARAQRATEFNCIGGKYPYYILPTSMAPGIQFWIGGLRNTDWTEEVRSVTNAWGRSESYTIYRLTSIQTGVLNIEVK